MSKPVFSFFSALSTYYDFDESGGAVSTIDLNLIIPKNTIITRILTRTWIAPTSAGAATISFDRIVGAVVTTGFYMVANPIANFNLTAGTEVLAGVDFNANPMLTSPKDDSTVGMSIAVAALTAGRIQIIIQVQNTDQLN
jgi:hypothetical protein